MPTLKAELTEEQWNDLKRVKGKMGDPDNAAFVEEMIDFIDEEWRAYERFSRRESRD